MVTRAVGKATALRGNLSQTPSVCTSYRGSANGGAAVAGAGAGQDLVATAGTVVTLTGRVDAATVATCRELLHRAVDDGPGPVVVDLTGVVVVDATGIGMLLGTARRAAHSGGSLRLRGTSPRLARLLHVTGLDRALPTTG